MADPKGALFDAFERLRMNHQSFRRADPEEIREIEAMRLDIIKMESSAPAPGVTTPVPAVVAMQLRLMERAFYVLQLTYFANAPENHGWMNLFRGWARSEDVHRIYEDQKDSLSPLFRSFYEHYIQGYARDDTMRRKPIHHPWLRTTEDRGPGIFMDSGRTEPHVVPMSPRPGEGGVIDSKGQAGADRGPETPSGGEPGTGGSGTNA